LLGSGADEEDELHVVVFDDGVEAAIFGGDFSP